MNKDLPGMRCCSMHDKSGRRGIWFREVKLGIQIVAGREGDDCEVTLTLGKTITDNSLAQLLSCLLTGAWMQEDEGPDIMGVNKEKEWKT